MKRNILLSVFLPLFLCAAILTLGYFSPTLFSRVMPNFKNKESAAQITGAESPLYLEDPSSLVLPPCPCGSGKKYKKCCGRNES